MARGLSLQERGSVVYDLAVAYESLVDAGAPGDVLAGVAYWLRRATREGLTDEDLAHVLDAVNAATLSRKPPP